MTNWAKFIYVVEVWMILFIVLRCVTGFAPFPLYSWIGFQPIGEDVAYTCRTSSSIELKIGPRLNILNIGFAWVADVNSHMVIKYRAHPTLDWVNTYTSVLVTIITNNHAYGKHPPTKDTKETIFETRLRVTQVCKIYVQNRTQTS